MGRCGPYQIAHSKLFCIRVRICLTSLMLQAISRVLTEIKYSRQTGSMKLPYVPFDKGDKVISMSTTYGNTSCSCNVIRVLRKNQPPRKRYVFVTCRGKQSTRDKPRGLVTRGKPYGLDKRVQIQGLLSSLSKLSTVVTSLSAGTRSDTLVSRFWHYIEDAQRQLHVNAMSTVQTTRKNNAAPLCQSTTISLSLKDYVKVKSHSFVYIYCI